MQKPLTAFTAEFWTVRSEAETATIAEQVNARCTQDVLPFLERLGTEAAILKELQSSTKNFDFIPVRGRAAIIQKRLGLTAQAQETLSAVSARFARDSARMRETDREVIDEFLLRVTGHIESTGEQCAPPNGGPSAPHNSEVAGNRHR